MCLGLHLYHTSMHVIISPFTFLPFLPFKTSPFLILSFFLLKLSQNQPLLPLPLNPRSIPLFPFLSFAFRSNPLCHSHLYTLIYFLFLLNFRKKQFFLVEKFLSVDENEIYWTESVVCVFRISTVPFIFHHFVRSTKNIYLFSIHI